MEKLQSLPFEVGQCVESRTFQKGFRGAWFRGKIKKFTHKGVSLEYYDFSDEISVLKLHQKVPRSNKAEEELMLRPHFPPVYCDGEVPDASTLSEVIVVKSGVWKVGDLVDWWCDNAYWSGKITQILGDDKIEIQSPSPPFGEGLSYEASCNDLRPSLEWSLEDGWKVPVPRGVANYSPCARLIHPPKQDKPGNKEEEDAEKEDEHTSPPLNGLQSKEKASEKQTGVVHEEGTSEQDSPKRIRLSETTPLNSTNCDTVESALIDLEELLNRVKWIKTILNPPEAGKPKSIWEFSEHQLSKDRTCRPRFKKRGWGGWRVEEQRPAGQSTMPAGAPYKVSPRGRSKHEGANVRRHQRFFICIRRGKRWRNSPLKRC